MSPNLLLNRHLGEVINTNRKAATISQAVLAERAGVTRRFIQELENGRSDVSLQTLFRLALALGVSLTEISRQIEEVMRSGYHE